MNITNLSKPNPPRYPLKPQRLRKSLLKNQKILKILSSAASSNRVDWISFGHRPKIISGWKGQSEWLRWRPHDHVTLQNFLPEFVTSFDLKHLISPKSLRRGWWQLQQHLQVQKIQSSSKSNNFQVSLALKFRWPSQINWRGILNHIIKFTQRYLLFSIKIKRSNMALQIVITILLTWNLSLPVQNCHEMAENTIK